GYRPTSWRPSRKRPACPYPNPGRYRRGFPAAAFAVLTFSGTWKTLEPGVATLVDYWAPSE
ncbi:hypothetical protein ACWDN9_32475, partial [Streptomyces nigra]